MDRGRITRVGGLFLVALMVAATLTGCSKSKKQQYDLALQEAAELRERNAKLESENRERDIRLADLENQLRSQPVAQAPVVIQQQPQGNSGGWSNGGYANDGGDFHRNTNGEMVAEIAGEVLFDSGSATLKSTAKRTLDRIAGQIRSQYNGSTIRIEGHTDSDPIRKSKWASNDALSQARAEAVRTYLSQKLSNNRMSAIGFGSTQPKGSKAASRRVEIVIAGA
ncbi:MAG: flagellar motor protein MotB [Phycisphaerales bacterium]|nr:MAG: OmpA family protein [Phycisphaerales bacterium]